MDSMQQLSLFELTRRRSGELVRHVPPPEELDAGSSLSAAIAAFYHHMRRQGFSENTIKAFGGDLKIFRGYLGGSQSIGDLKTEELNRFLNYLRFERGVPCNMKSYQRRLTSLKVFFAYLVEAKAIAQDPAATIPHLPVASPLPEILHDDQVDAVLAATKRLMYNEKSDARPHLLVTLLLTTGIKKSECMGLRLIDFDLSRREQPFVFIRYPDPRRRHKERKLKLATDFPETFHLYCERYKPRENLLECTPRNLEYVLNDVAQLAGLNGKISFEVLRWTSAVRDLKAGVPEEILRQKLGLSSITWQEAGDKIRRLAADPL